MKHRHFIDFHKGITFIYILFLIWYFDAYENQAIWIYLGLHGTYGILWVLKSRIFPDKSWNQKSSISYGVVILFGLSLYWVSPWIIASGYFYNIYAPGWLISLSIFFFGLGVFFHFSSDMQKHVYLKLRPSKLITEGLFQKSRNMNYFGELLIYLSFVLLSMHWIPLLILALFVLFVWIPNMKKKDNSLSRYDDFNEYKRKSNLFFPFF